MLALSNAQLLSFVLIPLFFSICLAGRADQSEGKSRPRDGPDIPEHSAIRNRGSLRQTIMRGRDGTDMPSWSVRFKGALDDQQIQDIVEYIISIQDPKLVPPELNVCTNTKAKGYVAPQEPAQ